MKSNNFLVTYDDLTTMELAAKGSPATGNQIATKQFINDNYFVDPAPLSTYANNQCPPYQTITPFFPAYTLGTSPTASGEVLLSTNAGGSWSVISQFTGTYTGPVKVTTTGQYMLVVSGTTLYLSSNYGSTWSSIASGSDISDIEMSDSGQYIVYVIRGGSGNVYISSNYGASFSTTGSPGVSSWRGVAMSSSGQYITLTSFNSYIWVSSNYGVSYTAKTAYPSTGWIPVVMSQSGQYQVAGAGTIYRSSNYGSTWTNTGASATNGWAKLAISGDGQYLLGLGDFDPLELWRSTNYGANWGYVTAIGSSGNGNWRSLAIAPDGVTQLVGASGSVWPTNLLYKSTNYGATFSSVSGTDIKWDALGLSNTVGTSTTTTTTTAAPYDYYLANEYECGPTCSTIINTDVPVAFPAGYSYIGTHYYNDINLDGFLYKITSTTTPQVAIILDPTAPHGTNCSTICAV